MRQLPSVGRIEGFNHHLPEKEHAHVFYVDGVVAYRDLLLDLWVAPDGQTQTLDDDEFAADTTLDAPTRAAARAALADLQALVARRAPPFDVLPGAPA